MRPLEKSLRNLLEKTVKEARDVAEDAARAALTQLGVGEALPFSHLTESERELRRRLRAHGRQLGDRRYPENATQDIDRLVEEVAYEHWHRMLFARFLAENDLLMYPDPDDPVPITLEECEDLAADEGAKNGWELAARFAAGMLPQIFRTDSPVFQLELPPEHQQKLERLVSELPAEVFTASDSLGWVYQFWQAKKKDEVNASEVKIGARELPAVTQLFTEPYMVSFLLDNSLGAWWAARYDAGLRGHGDTVKGIFSRAKSEEEIRSACTIAGVPLNYLRFVRVEQNSNTPRPPVPSSLRPKWTPAGGTFDRWPDNLSELKVLDPCCGSGHFLVAALLMLVPMRMKLEGLTAREAMDAVLRDNLHGLEIDQRCVELAAFALALTAWRYPGAGGYRKLPELNLACSGLSISVSRKEWQKLANGNHNLRVALGLLHDEFQFAPVLGSLLNPTKSAAAKLVDWKDLAEALEAALEKERSDEEKEAGVVAHGLAKAASLLADKYHWIITNVPYLACGKQSEKLRDFCATHYKEAKNDLATVFLDRCLELCVEGGAASIVLPQNWLFLTSYKKFREKLLKNDTWHLIARLGPGAFETISGEVVKAILLCLSRGICNEQLTINNDQLTMTNEQRKGDGSLFAVNCSLITGIDVSEPRTAAEKAAQLVTAEIKQVEQAKQLGNPDAVVVFQTVEYKSLLSDFASINYGSKPGQTDRVVCFHWELPVINSTWQFLESTPSGNGLFSGKEKICFSLEEVEKQKIKEFGIRSANIWGKHGIIQSQMREMPFSIYLGKIFDNNTSVIHTAEVANLLEVLCFVESGEYLSEIRKINQKLDVAAHTMVKVPFDLDRWTKVAQEKYPNGLPNPYTNDPTQWIFHGHPCGSVIWDEEKKWTAHGPLRTDSTVLQVAVARLLGYRWPAERDAETRGRVGAGEEAMELSDESRFWVRQCDELLPLADEDGIVCIPPVRGEASAADRLLNLLERAYTQFTASPCPRVSASFSVWLQQLLASADHAGKTLETWLRDKFFAQHCKLFHHRPFIWHIWDGLRDGFAALVNYHKLDRKNLETLIYTYLGDWINRQKCDCEASVDGAEEKLAAALSLKKKLELILKGESPHDIFVRWKPIEKQPIGWEPDLNDSVRLNIRPFMTVGDVKKRGAGILRDKPNIKWTKDRGKDVKSAPWYHLGPEYGFPEGTRINDHHLTLAEKRKAREEAGDE